MKLVCPSGQTEKAVVATANWATDAAQARFETILSSYYADGTKTILTQCAKSAKTVKSSYFSAQHQRISARRGKNRATLAVAHSMLIAIYHILKNKTVFHDLGSDYYDSFNRDRKINSYLKRLKALGWEPDAIPSSA